MKLPLWRIAEFVGAKGECDQEAVAMAIPLIHARSIPVTCLSPLPVNALTAMSM